MSGNRFLASIASLVLALTPTVAVSTDGAAGVEPSSTVPDRESETVPCNATDAGRTAGPVTAHGLDALARLAAESHASVMARRAGVQAAQAEWEAAQLQNWPTPSAQTSPGVGGGRTTVLSLEQPLWTGGRLDAIVDAAEARAHAAHHAVTESVQSVGLAVVNAYQGFAQAQGRAAVMHRFLARLERYRESMQRRVQSGASAAGELELLQARHAFATGQLKWACSNERVARSQLAVLASMDLSPEAVVRSVYSPEVPNLGDLLDRAQQHSPLLRRLAQDLRSAQGEVSAKVAQRWPTVTLVAQRHLQRGVPDTQSTTSVGLQLQFNPGAGFSSLASARAAQAQVDVLRAGLEAARADLVSRIRAEHEELRSAVMRREDGLLHVAAAGRVLASYERLFAVGKRNWLDVMNAARELSDAELVVADMEAQVGASRYRLALYAVEPEWMKAGP
jgi:adhesin transport system outer membrane protein